MRLRESIVNNIGIRTDLRKIPEYMEFHNYYFAPHPIVRWFRRIFRAKKIDELRKKAHQATLPRILDTATYAKYVELDEASKFNR